MRTVALETAIRESVGIHDPGRSLPTADAVAALPGELVFSTSALAQAQAVGRSHDAFETREAVEGVVFSVDHAGTCDLDNALSFRRAPDGNLIIGVHATDVAAWLKIGSPLDFAARRRAQTRYLPGEAFYLPMLPIGVTEDRLSLLEGKPRLSRSVELVFTPAGELVGRRIFKSKLINAFQLTPEQADLASRGEGRAAQYPELAEAICSLTRLGARVRAVRKGTGPVDDASRVSIEKALGDFTSLSARLVGEALVDAGLEASYRNQPKLNAKSSYDAEATGHASFGSRAYATWTGPMRRYSDVDNQRAMDRLERGVVPTGRLAELDHSARQRQLERANGLRRDHAFAPMRSVLDILGV